MIASEKILLRNELKISMRDYVDTRYDNISNVINLRIEGVQRAVTIANDAMTERLKILNEFKDTYLKMQGEFARENNTKTSFQKIEADIRELRSIADIAKGKASQNALLVSIVIAIISLVISAIRLFGK